MRTAFNEELLKIAKKDKRIFMILADIGYGEIEPFAENFPDRFINCGVAEQNMTGVAYGPLGISHHSTEDIAIW